MRVIGVSNHGDSLPVPFHAPDPDHGKAGNATALNPTTPPADPPASANKEKAKEKKSDKDKSSAH